MNFIYYTGHLVFYLPALSTGEDRTGVFLGRERVGWPWTGKGQEEGLVTTKEGWHGLKDHEEKPKRTSRSLLLTLEPWLEGDHPKAYMEFPVC